MDTKEIRITVELDREDLWNIKVGLESYIKQLSEPFDLDRPDTRMLRKIYGFLGMSHEFEPMMEHLQKQADKDCSA